LGADNRKLFEEQLEAVLQCYPNLTIKEKNGAKYLKGVLDVVNQANEVAGSFLIEIHYAVGFPLRFPILYEIGGLIPFDPDWHKYGNASCCITVEPDEILKCRLGISVLRFINEQAVPFLANFLYRKAEGKYKNGEYSHGPSGHEEFYAELLKTSDKSLWLDYYECTFNSKKLINDRNKPCFCGSNIKFKMCHDVVLYTLRNIGKRQVLSDFRKIIR
jgi:hypothetical protein